MYEKLKEVMKSKGITTNRLARMSNITSQSLYSALKGDVKLYDGWKKRIAEALETPEEELFAE